MNVEMQTKQTQKHLTEIRENLEEARRTLRHEIRQITKKIRGIKAASKAVSKVTGESLNGSKRKRAKATPASA